MFHSKTVTTLPFVSLGEAASEAVVQALDAFEVMPLKRKAFPSLEQALLDNKALHRTEQPRRKAKSQSWRFKCLPMVGRLLAPTDGTKGPCVCYCSRYAKRGAGGKSVQAAEVLMTESGRLKVEGLAPCGSAWLCPVCTVSQARKQWAKTEKVLRRCRELGGIAVMITNTLGREPDEHLRVLKSDLLEVLAAARDTRQWKGAMKSGELFGTLPFIEVLHGVDTGWHIHGHSLAVFVCSRERVEEIVATYQADYVRLMGKRRAVDAAAQHFTIIASDDDLARYITKSNASWEVSGGIKAARSRRSRSVWDLVFLADAGDMRAAALFREYAEVMPGTRSGVVHPAMAKKLGLSVAELKAMEEPQPDAFLLVRTHVDVLVRVANHAHLADLSDAVEALSRLDKIGSRELDALEDRIFQWARCTEDERNCYRDLLADVLEREEKRP